MKKERVVELPIKDIRIDNALYPRDAPDPVLVRHYQGVIRIRGEMRPVVIGRTQDGPVLLDGRHRFLAYRKMGKHSIPAIFSHVDPKDFFAEAVRLNAEHGRPFSPHERHRNIVRLKKSGYREHVIAHIIAIPVTSIRRIIAGRIIPIHAGQIRHTMRQALSHTGLPSQEHLLRSLLYLIEENTIDWHNAGVVRLLERLRTALLKLKVPR